MSKIKIGDRVSARAFMEISVGTVIYIRQKPYEILVKFDTWYEGHSGGLHYQEFELDYDKENCSHWWFNDGELVLVGKSDEI